MRVMVVGQIGRDLVLRVERLPGAGGSESVAERRELLGGKGANQAVGLRQLGASVGLVGVVGTDPAGDLVLDEAERDGLDVGCVTRRGQTALLVDVVEPGGARRLLEYVPRPALLQPPDVAGAAGALRSADVVCLQLQQPAEALLVAARAAHEAGARVVLDGAVTEPHRDRLLRLADVVRADAEEARLLTGAPIDSVADARRAAAELRAAGPPIVALAVPGQGDLVSWPDGDRFLPLSDGPVLDPTGAGDAFVAGLVTGLERSTDVAAAGELAAAAAAASVTRLGGRPDLTEM